MIEKFEREPICSSWLNPIEMLWRHFRRKVTQWELFGSVDAVLGAAVAFCDPLQAHARCSCPSPA